MKAQDENTFQSGFLQNLSLIGRAKLLRLADSFHYEPGETIFRQDDPSVYLFLIKSGTVAIEFHVHPCGNRRILTLGAGELFSWSALLEPRHETATAKAIQSTDVFAIKGGLLGTTH